MDISLGANKYKMPINLLCLFGIPKPIWVSNDYVSFIYKKSFKK